MEKEELLSSNRHRSKSAFKEPLQRKVNEGRLSNMGVDVLRTAIELCADSTSSPIRSLSTLVDSSFSATEAVLQHMKEASNDRHDVRSEPLTVDEYSLKKGVNKTSEKLKRNISSGQRQRTHNERQIVDFNRAPCQVSKSKRREHLPRHTKWFAQQSDGSAMSDSTKQIERSANRPRRSHAVSPNGGHRASHEEDTKIINECGVKGVRHPISSTHLRRRSFPSKANTGSSRLITADKDASGMESTFDEQCSILSASNADSGKLVTAHRDKSYEKQTSQPAVRVRHRSKVAAPAYTDSSNLTTAAKDSFLETDSLITAGQRSIPTRAVIDSSELITANKDDATSKVVSKLPLLSTKSIKPSSEFVTASAATESSAHVLPEEAELLSTKEKTLRGSISSQFIGSEKEARTDGLRRIFPSVRSTGMRRSVSRRQDSGRPAKVLRKKKRSKRSKSRKIRSKFLMPKRAARIRRISKSDSRYCRYKERYCEECGRRVHLTKRVGSHQSLAYPMRRRWEHEKKHSGSKLVESLRIYLQQTSPEERALFYSPKSKCWREGKMKVEMRRDADPRSIRAHSNETNTALENDPTTCVENVTAADAYHCSASSLTSAGVPFSDGLSQRTVVTAREHRQTGMRILGLKMGLKVVQRNKQSSSVFSSFRKLLTQSSEQLPNSTTASVSNLISPGVHKQHRHYTQEGSSAHFSEQCLSSPGHLTEREICSSVASEESPYISENAASSRCPRCSVQRQRKYPFRTYCMYCGCRHIFTRIRRGRSRHGNTEKQDDAYEQGHEPWCSRATSNENDDFDECEYSSSKRLGQHGQTQLNSETVSHNDGEHEHHDYHMTKRASRSAKSNREEAAPANIRIHRSRERRKYARKRSGGYPIARSQESPQNEVTIRTANSSESISLQPPTAMSPTAVTAKSLLEKTLGFPKRQLPAPALTKSPSETHIKSSTAESPKMRTVKSGSFNLAASPVFEAVDAEQQSTYGRGTPLLIFRQSCEKSNDTVTPSRATSSIMTTMPSGAVVSETISAQPSVLSTRDNPSLVTIKKLNSPQAQQTSLKDLSTVSTALSPAEDLPMHKKQRRQFSSHQERPQRFIAQSPAGSNSVQSVSSHHTFKNVLHKVEESPVSIVVPKSFANKLDVASDQERQSSHVQRARINLNDQSNLLCRKKAVPKSEHTTSHSQSNSQCSSEDESTSDLEESTSTEQIYRKVNARPFSDESKRFT
ncbi:unnamed protein product [Toxocara canis]|uniref:C2H2-type domain-containing protein n=1 Tax=Toxocara canis TaxID=6265 RepID=A0A183ULY4_TOXCA|nr:unnamed protein product [Toxocara canis]